MNANAIDYQKQAQDFLTKHNITFNAILIGDDCPAFCPDAEAGRDMDKVNVFPRRTHIHGKHYRVSFQAKERTTLYLDFWNSYQDAESNAFHHGRGEIYNRSESYWDRHRGTKYPGVVRKPLQIPAPYNVLACIIKSDPGTFDDFCRDFDYDSDSRKAETTYRAVVEEWRKVRAFFTADELAEVQEVS